MRTSIAELTARHHEIAVAFEALSAGSERALRTVLKRKIQGLEDGGDGARSATPLRWRLAGVLWTQALRTTFDDPFLRAANYSIVRLAARALEREE